MLHKTTRRECTCHVFFLYIDSVGVIEVVRASRSSTAHRLSYGVQAAAAAAAGTTISVPSTSFNRETADLKVIGDVLRAVD